MPAIRVTLAGLRGMTQRSAKSLGHAHSQTRAQARCWNSSAAYAAGHSDWSALPRMPRMQRVNANPNSSSNYGPSPVFMEAEAYGVRTGPMPGRTTRRFLSTQNNRTAAMEAAGRRNAMALANLVASLRICVEDMMMLFDSEEDDDT